MPFNSPYNDYMYVIDEYNNLGWFASDRFQPEGKVLSLIHILAQVNTPIKGKSKTLKRLRIQQIFGALALILTGAFMFTTRGNEWIACLTIAAILELYTAFRIPQEEEKEKAN